MHDLFTFSMIGVVGILVALMETARNRSWGQGKETRDKPTSKAQGKGTKGPEIRRNFVNCLDLELS
jgi:hypothetical protein